MTHLDQATIDTIERINWHYGRGRYRDVQGSPCGAVVASFAKQYGMDVCKVTFPRPGFVRVRGQTRKVRAHA